MKTKHKQKTVVIDGWNIKVDINLAKLINSLCLKQYYTCLSCQDNVDNKVWICFEGWRANKLMRDIFESRHRKLFNYLSNDAEWSIVYSDASSVSVYRSLEVLHSLRFPKKDLKKVEKMFLKFLGK